MNNKMKDNIIASKKPPLADFSRVMEEVKGNVSNAARMLGVSRMTIMNWCKSDVEFGNVLSDSRKSLLDKCISTAQLLAMGIPELDEDKRIIGWKEKPDGSMLRYFMSTLGQDEGFSQRMDIGVRNGVVGINLFSEVDSKDEFEKAFEEEF